MIWRMLLFLCIFSALLGGVHVYLYRRLIRRPFGPRRWGRWLFIAIPLLMLLGLPLSRALPRELLSPVGFFVFGWLAVLSVLLPMLWGVDIVGFIGRRLLRDAEGFDPKRRLAINRGVGLLTLGGLMTAARRGAAETTPSHTRVEIPIKGLDPRLDGFKIVQISDVHIGPTLDAGFMEWVVKEVNSQSPDLVAITGDLVDGAAERIGHEIDALADLKSAYGSFFVTGNHEYFSGVDGWLKRLRALGVRTLRNERVRIDHDGAPLDLLGVDDWRSASFGHGPDLKRAVEDRDLTVPSVLLAHQPRAIYGAAEEQLDVMLCGHTHGGQIWPWAFIALLVEPYLKGLHLHDGTWIYVHKGTGYWGPPLRLGAPAEIASVILRAA